MIVSGDDRTEEILGYSNTGTFDEIRMPSNMRAFLQSYADGIQYLDDHHVEAAYQPATSRRAASKTSIKPLMSSTWDQEAPYNHECPAIGSQTAYTGCVATAMAQVMYYHRWPDATTAPIPAYQTGNYKINLEEVPAGVPLDWNSMTASYWNRYQGTAAEKAVATLMKLCGQSVQMDYGLDADGGSSAYSQAVAAALINYFDYEEATTRFINRKNYTYNEWQDIIYAELAADRPVLYGGMSKGGGHEFVCDGYDKDDFFHINWGWGGMSDGYFRLRLLDPNQQGAGGSATNDGYGMLQDAVIGIQKNDDISIDLRRLTVEGFTTKAGQTYTRTSASNDFRNVPVSFTVLNYTGVNLNFDLGYRILDGEGKAIYEFNDTQNAAFSNLNGYIYNKNLSFGANIGNGDYRLIPTSRVNGTDIMIADDGADIHYIDFNINGNKLTITHTVQEPNLTVVKTDIQGIKEAFAPVTVTYTIKNNGPDAVHTDLTYGLGLGSAQTRFEQSYCAFLELANAETGTVTVEFIPQTTGTYYLHLLTDDGLEIGNAIPIEIKASTAPKLTVTDVKYTPEMKEENGSYYVNNKTVNATLTIKNEGGKDYTDKIWVRRLMRSAGTWYYLGNTMYEQIDVNIPVGKTYELQTEITNEYGESADLFCIEYYSIQNNDLAMLYSTPDFELRDANAVSLTVSDVVIANSNPETKTITGGKFDIALKLTNNGGNTFNDNITFAVQAYTTSELIGEGWGSIGWLGTTITQSIPAGETVTVRNKPFAPLGSEYSAYGITEYRVIVHYGNSMTNSNVLYITDGYTITDNSGVNEILVDPQGKARKVYDLKGRQVGTSEQMESLQPGLYIINGKKVVKK